MIMKPLRSSQSVLFIIDMIEGFVNEGPLSDSTIAHIVPNIRRMIEKFVLIEYPIIAINDAHHDHSREFVAFPPHCLAHSSESKMLNDLHHPHIQVMNKNSVNAFMSPMFQAWFKDAPIYERYIISGCVSDICILHFALSLNSYFHEHDIETQVIVMSDGIETFHHDTHDRQTYHETALKLMSQVGILTLESESL
jgi:nicotinamidase-related amidase